MYGTGIGTGASGSAALATGMASGSYMLAAVAAVCFGLMAWTLMRNHRRREAHQRP